MENYRLSIDIVKLSENWIQNAFPSAIVWKIMEFFRFMQIDAMEFTDIKSVIGFTKRSSEPIQINSEK